MNEKIFTALTIAGSDSGGGAGIQADLKTFQAMGVYGSSVITAVTAQNTVRVSGVLFISPEMVAAQIEAVFEDISPGAVKTGMLGDAAIVETVARKVEQYRIENLIIDPVMVATSGDSLLEPEAVKILKTRLIPKALVITPNLAEAEELAGFPVRSRREMEEAARVIRGLGPEYVIIKGGHRSKDADDLVYDGEEMIFLPSPRLTDKKVHGTGCIFSAAITAGLARRLSPPEAIAAAKAFIIKALTPPLEPGQGSSVGNIYILSEEK
ncbi:MAG: bifunctional hydroxymethylpyrimidine kinase/phosphomethylpyrimidine kinase [Candidatus Auribacterota bacterium]|nr:bifunctional hydroxymethylpyrimidine kinase/phosphomethylpyrimidine kinase [Candidatus Auribacterota bacterium]